MKLKHFAVFGGIFTVIICLLLFLFIVTADDEESGSSSLDFSGLNLSAEVLKHQPTVEKYAKEYGISDYVNYLLAIMQVESGGTGTTDVMQASESLGLPLNSLSTEESIRQGCKYFSELLKSAESKGCDINTVVQAYNYGGGFIDYVASHGKKYTFELAVSFAKEKSGGVKITYKNEISIKENDIAFLAGEYPRKIERSVLPEEVKLPENLPVGLPSTLLERRPDVRQAEQKLIAANATVGLAYTNMFPRLALTAHYGLESAEFSDFLKSPYHFLSGSLLTPLFAMGKNRAMLKAKKAAYEQEVYSYEKSVLTAFKDARNAIVDFNKIKDIYESRLQLEQAAQTNVELAQLQYINGVIGYLDVLDAQRGYFDAQIGLSNAIRDKQITLVRLYKACLLYTSDAADEL